METIAIGEDKNWFHGLLEIVNRIDTPYIILISLGLIPRSLLRGSSLLEDFFFRGHVNIEDVYRCVEALKSLDGNMLRLVPCPRPLIARKTMIERDMS